MAPLQLDLGVLIILKGCQNCQLLTVNCQFGEAAKQQFIYLLILAGNPPFEQPMPVAEEVHTPSSPQPEPGFRVALGIELHQLEPIRSGVDHKGDEVLLGHGMPDGNEFLILHLLNGNRMLLIRLLRLQGRKRNSAAADHGFSRTVNYISADRADIELRPEHIAGNIPVGDGLSVHQLQHRHPQRLRQGLQQRNIRQPPAGIT